MKDHEADISTSVTNEAVRRPERALAAVSFKGSRGLRGWVGVGGSLGGVLAGCGEDAETTTTAAPVQTTVAPVQTTEAETVGTTATAGEPAAGREIRIGLWHL
jgi:septal ring-binding cell division protein DamX